jgi:hypothetical protein
MNKKQNIYPMSNLVGKNEFNKKAKVEPTLTPKSDILSELPRFLLEMSKAIMIDDNNWHKNFSETKRSPNSSACQRFWCQSHYYRAVLSYSCLATLKGSSKSISNIAKDTGMSIQQAMKIANEAEDAGYIHQYNKGNASLATTVAATDWQLIDYIHRYVMRRLFLWNEVREDYSTDHLHDKFIEPLLNDQNKIDAFRDMMNNLAKRAIETED